MPCFKEPLHSKFVLGVKCLICQIPIHVISMTVNPTQICTDLSYLLSMRVCCHAESLTDVYMRSGSSSLLFRLWNVCVVKGSPHSKPVFFFPQTSFTSHRFNVFLSSRKHLMTRLLPNCLFRVKRALSQKGNWATGQKATCFVLSGCMHVKSILMNRVIEKLVIVGIEVNYSQMYSVNKYTVSEMPLELYSI